METTGKTIILFIVLCVSGCKGQIDIEKEKALLLASNERQRQAHFDRNPSLLVQEMADTVYTVQRGNIRLETQSSMMKRWEPYFKSVNYSVWDDLQEPLIHISGDGEMATVSVRKITVSTRVDNPASGVDTTYFAWTSGYKKVNGLWKIYTMASTRIPKP